MSTNVMKNNFRYKGLSQKPRPPEAKESPPSVEERAVTKHWYQSLPTDILAVANWTAVASCLRKFPIKKPQGGRMALAFVNLVNRQSIIAKGQSSCTMTLDTWRLGLLYVYEEPDTRS